jgi:hypothetical protein
MTAWMDEQSAKRGALGEGNWYQEKGKKTPADSSARPKNKDQRERRV